MRFSIWIYADCMCCKWFSSCYFRKGSSKSAEIQETKGLKINQGRI